MPGSMQLALALPPDARPDLAFRDARALKTPAPGSGVIYDTDGNWYELVDSLFATFTTDATVGNRTVLVRVVDGSNKIVYDVPAPQPQPPGTATDYTASADLGFAYSPGSGFQVIALPPILLLPTWELRLTFQGPGGVDAFSAVYLVSTKIPTGPAPSPQAPIATPVVV